MVLGAAGRMGSTVCQAVSGDPALELAAAVDPAFAAGAEAPAGARAAGSLGELAGEDLDVAVDFTTAGAVLLSAGWCAREGVHLVCGTTGLDDAGLATLRRLFGEPQAPNCILAPNFAISAVLMMRLAELAARFFDGAEIVELHHGAKRDAPSGTALETARRIVAARAASGAGPFAPDPTTEGLAGARGARVEGEGGVAVAVHGVRLPGLVAHQEVIFGASGQSLTIRQDSYDRFSFMPGVLLAVHEVASRPGLTVGLEPLLGI